MLEAGATDLPEASRREGWSPATLIREMRGNPDRTVADICADYSIGARPSTLIRQVARWRKEDPEFRALYEQELQRRNQSHKRGGHPSKEDLDPVGTADWRLRFVEELVESGSRIKAAEVTPYEYDSIYKRLTPKYEEFEPDFFELVHQAEMRIAAEMEGGFIEAFRDAADPKTKAWIAKEGLKVFLREKWGDKLKMEHSGEVIHRHGFDSLPRAEKIRLLVEDQTGFFGQEPGQKALVQSSETAEILDAELVPVESHEQSL